MSMDERLHVRTDRRALRGYVRRMSWLIVGGNAVATMLVGVLWGLAVSGSDGLLLPVVGGAVIAGLGFANGCATLTTGVLGRLRSRRDQHTVLIVDATGIRMPVPASDAGEVFLPWSLVGDVDRRAVSRYTLFAIKGRPVVRADHPGAEGLHDPVIMRAVAGPGLQLGTRFLTADADTIATTIERFRRSAAVDRHR
jgi:hypothetical protein